MLSGGVSRVSVASPLRMGSLFHPVLLASRPNEILVIDFTVLDPSSSGLENVLVMIYQKVHSGGSHTGSAGRDGGPSVSGGVVLQVWGSWSDPLGSGPQFRVLTYKKEEIYLIDLS